MDDNDDNDNNDKIFSIKMIQDRIDESFQYSHFPESSFIHFN